MTYASKLFSETAFRIIDAGYYYVLIQQFLNKLVMIIVFLLLPAKIVAVIQTQCP